jgi:hypothetical protein
MALKGVISTGSSPSMAITTEPKDLKKGLRGGRT